MRQPYKFEIPISNPKSLQDFGQKQNVNIWDIYMRQNNRKEKKRKEKKRNEESGDQERERMIYTPRRSIQRISITRDVFSDDSDEVVSRLEGESGL